MDSGHRNPVCWARGLVRIRTLACGAGDPGFKSPRARQISERNNLINANEAFFPSMEEKEKWESEESLVSALVS